jgi:hypothetical protein
MHPPMRRRVLAALGLLTLGIAVVLGGARYADGQRSLGTGLVAACAALVLWLAALGGWGRRGASPWLAAGAVLAAAAAVALGVGADVEGARLAASGTALYCAFGLVGLLLMVRPYEFTLPRWLQGAGGNLLFFGMLLGLGFWVVPEVAPWAYSVCGAGALVALVVALRWPKTLDDPEQEQRSEEPSPLEMTKDDHLLPLAEVQLKNIASSPALRAALDARLEEQRSRLSASPEGQNQAVGPQAVPEAVKLEIMADLLVSDAEGRKAVEAAASSRARVPAFVKRLAQRVVDAHGAGPDPCRRELRQLLETHAPEALAGLGQPGESAGSDGQAATLEALHRKLMLDPSLAARLAEVVGASVPFALALQAELDEIQESRKQRLGGPQDADGKQRYAPRRALDMDLVGLAFSGGGIRSATFNLGILQALADLRLLPRVDYLSTVSGGGYIGSWFVSWAKRLAGGVGAVQGRLSPRNSPDPEAPRVRPIRFLREYSNYLTPRLGLLGADTWSAFGIWLRNTFLVQSVLILFLAVVLLVPRLLGLAVICSAKWPDAASWAVGAVGLWLFLVVCLRTGTEMRRYGRERGEKDGKRKEWAPPSKAGYGRVQATILLPAFGCCLMSSLALWHWAFRAWTLPGWLLVAAASPGPVTVIGVGLLALGLALIALRAGYAPVFRRGEAPASPLVQWVVFLLAVLGPAVVGGTLLSGVASLYDRWHGQDVPGAPWHVIALGVPLLGLVFGLSVVLHNGLMGRYLQDDRREWWSRLGAWLMIWTFGWLAAFGIAVYGPLLVTRLAQWMAAMGGVTWLASVAWGAYMANRSSPDPAGGKESGPAWKNVVALVAPYVFIVGLLILTALGLHLLLLRLAVAPADWEQVSWTSLARDHWEHLAKPGWPLVLAALAGAAAVGAVLAWRVDVNEFSMHYLYKNRLVRCYLGASRDGRDAHPFTGLDLADDLQLSTLRTKQPCVVADQAAPPDPADGYVGPLPILNTVLNLVKGDDLAWQERKAQSFVFTPLFSGYEHIPPRGRRTAERKTLSCDGFRPTRAYGDSPKGLHLGTAMAISGAAANPNMGYHSSPAAAFLLTMFNVRLGWWLGNPRDDRTWRRSSPTFGLASLLAELTGSTTNSSRFVNLSDGGHFENLGIYELVRRRCRFIIACDAEQDPNLKLSGLGSALRKCRTDFGVEIKIRTDLISRRKNGYSKAHSALGDILYPGGDRGFLLYLKSSLVGDEPGDVLEYSRRVEAFPHESTADQFFDESQFESYRQLGYHIASEVLGAAAKDAGQGTPQGEYWRSLLATAEVLPNETGRRP